MTNTLTFNDKLTNLFKNYVLVAGIFVIYFLAIGILNVAFPEWSLDSFKETRLQDMMRDNPWRFFFLAVVVAPFFEESLYRSLVQPKPWELVLFFSCVILFFAGRLVPDDVVWYLKSIISLLSLFLIYKVLLELISKNFLKMACARLTKFKLPIIVFTSVAFGFAHVSNYTEEFILTWPIFIAIIPRIILGFMFCKIKLENNGLPWAMGLHGINNGIVFIISSLTLNTGAV